jgi:tetratricopeptide (TPR) repeat protein
VRSALVLFLSVQLTLAAFAVGPENPVLGPNADYQQAVKLIKQEQYAMAIPLLEKLDAAHPREPEVLNWLGFSHRKLKNYPDAKKFYDAALAVEPTYRPALEYQGMWFIETGDIASAKANLAKLMAICASCEETADLVDALKKAGY